MYLLWQKHSLTQSPFKDRKYTQTLHFYIFIASKLVLSLTLFAAVSYTHREESQSQMHSPAFHLVPKQRSMIEQQQQQQGEEGAQQLWTSNNKILDKCSFSQQCNLFRSREGSYLSVPYINWKGIVCDSKLHIWLTLRA